MNIVRLTALAIGVLVPWAAAAAPFADPTRPPDAVPDGPAAVRAGPMLESVLIAPDRRIAVISGRQVRLGDEFDGGKIVRITESEVSIRNGESTEVLKLFPEVEKRSGPRRQKGKQQ
jgi:hypothetical protein